MYARILVPVDGSALADRTVEQALALARVHGATVLFLHAQPDFGASQEGALLHALAPALYAEGAAGGIGLVLARAQAAARAAGVDSRALASRHDRPHLAVLEAAAAERADLIFMASHGRRGLAGTRLGGVTRRVLEAAPCPVLVAAVELNQAMDAQARALDTIRAEHRSLAAVMHALREHWRQVQAGVPPRPDLMRAMLFYIEQFPERRHHPKEDDYLFARLRQRTRECDALLDRLQAQHREGTRLFQDLRLKLAALEAGEPGASAHFGQALEAFVTDQWQHMSSEERFVLPAAGRWLAGEDWEAIAAAFGSNGDPRFGADDDEAFGHLAERLLRLAAAPVG